MSNDVHDQTAEIAALRARVAELEAQLARKDAETAQLVATAQEKLYWLERWHVDLDTLMRKPGRDPAAGRAAQRCARSRGRSASSSGGCWRPR